MPPPSTATATPSHTPAGTAVPPLLGYTVAVTASRRREEFGAALAEQGATVVYGPAVRIVRPDEDTRLRAITERALAEPIDHLVVTTAVGFREWVAAIGRWGLGPGFEAAVEETLPWVRAADSAAAVRAAGLRSPWSAPRHTTGELLDLLLEQPSLAGRRIVIQLHGDPPVPIAPSMAGAAPYSDVVHTLRSRGAEVIELPVFRWEPPKDVGPLRAVIDGVVGGAIDAVTFTSPAAVASVLGSADDLGVGPELRGALGSQVLAACIGPVTGATLAAAGIDVAMPDEHRLDAFVRSIAEQVPAHRGRRFRAAGHDFDVRGHALVLDGEVRHLPATGMTLLRALAHRPGQVITRDRLLTLLPGERVTGHAVDVAMGRLRSALGDPAVIATVVKRGYRLALD